MTSRFALAFAAATAAFAFAAEAGAAPCRDAKGHFTACPAPAARAATQRCRDAKGHFASCAAVGSAMNTAAAAPAPLPAAPPRASMARAAPPPRASMARVGPAPTGRAANTAAIAPGAVTALCRDGTPSHSQHRSGTCAGHGGVAQWM